jgi:hypothetical protein
MDGSDRTNLLFIIANQGLLFTCAFGDYRGVGVVVFEVFKEKGL